MAEIREGYMPFRGMKTYYRIVGHTTQRFPAPLVLLHGGPGSTHNYFEVLDPLADEGMQLIMYDQLGCGLSYVEGHPELWVLDTWMDELDALRDHLRLERLHLLGQSFGGMLAIAYYIEYHPRGIASLVLSSTLSSSKLWAKEQHMLMQKLSAADQSAIREAEAANDFTGERVIEATAHFMERFCSGPVTESSPECLRRKGPGGRESYLTAWGPNEFTATGTLRDFDYTDRLGEIDVPALVLRGSRDLCTETLASTLQKGIPGAESRVFEGARHACCVDAREAYMQTLLEWMECHR